MVYIYRHWHMNALEGDEVANEKLLYFHISIYASQRLQTFDMACRQLDENSVADLLESIDTVLLDCDGVLWKGAASAPLPGVPETIAHLRQLGKKVYFVSNISTKNRAEHAEKCNNLGYPCTEEEMITSSYVTAQYIQNTLKYSGKCYVIGSPGLQGELNQAGITCIGLGEDPWNGRTVRDLIETELDPEVKCVVIGFDKDFSFIKLYKAQAYLNDPQCHFLVTNPDAGLPIGGGRLLPGAGALARSVAFVAGREPTVCGKPQGHVADILREMHQVNASRTLMVGDNLATDVHLAHNCGMKSLLVLSGFSSLDDVMKKQTSSATNDTKLIPDFYLPSLADLGPLMNQV